MIGAQSSAAHSRPPVPRLASDRSVHLLARGLSALCGHTEPAWGPRGGGVVCPGCSAVAARPSRSARAVVRADDSGSEPAASVQVEVCADGCEVEIMGGGVRLRLRYVVRPL